MLLCLGNEISVNGSDFLHTFMSTDMPIFVLDSEQSSSSIYKKIPFLEHSSDGGGEIQTHSSCRPQALELNALPTTP